LIIFQKKCSGWGDVFEKKKPHHPKDQETGSALTAKALTRN